MARYIDAEILKKSLSHYENEDAIYRDEIEMYIDDTPTAEVAEVRHGRWIKHKPDSEYIKGLHQLGIAKGMGENSIYWTCSECEHWGVLHYKYCPNCGARMDGDEE